MQSHVHVIQCIGGKSELIYQNSLRLSFIALFNFLFHPQLLFFSSRRACCRARVSVVAVAMYGMSLVWNSGILQLIRISVLLLQPHTNRYLRLRDPSPTYTFQPQTLDSFLNLLTPFFPTHKCLRDILIDLLTSHQRRALFSRQSD